MIQLLQATGDEGWARWVKDGDPVWYCISDFTEHEIPKGAGFLWNPTKRLWWTNDRDKACKLADYATGELNEELLKLKIHQDTSLTLSREVSAEVDYPKPDGEEYLPYQKAGIRYMLDRPGTMLTDEMGLGKTIQVLGLINAVPEMHNILIICPASLKTNWLREFQKWNVTGLKAAKADTNTCLLPEHGYSVVIINYESLAKNVKDDDGKNTGVAYNHPLDKIKWDLVAVDEAHRMKETKSLSYRAIKGLTYKRVVVMTGTPIQNRPYELWTLLSIVDPERWNYRKYRYYHSRYCNARQGRFGYDKKGVNEERLQELQTLLRSTCMIRRLKEDVLKELPPKRRQIVELEYKEGGEIDLTLKAQESVLKRRESMLTKLRAQLELAKAGEDDEGYRVAIRELQEGVQASFEEMTKLRYQTGILKAPMVIEYAKQLLENVDKLVIMCWHTDVVEAIAAGIPGAVYHHGKLNEQQKQNAVDTFVNNLKCQVLVGNIKATGEGLTLTVASHMIMAEQEWVPGRLQQAEDRVHRIGQDKPANYYYMVLQDSIDCNMLRTVLSKMEIIEKALDKEESEIPTVPGEEKSSTKGLSRKKIEEESLSITVDEIGTIHEGLRMLAEMDKDHSRLRNGVGFNMIDSHIGHSLADQIYLTPKQAVLGRRILRKYGAQLPEKIMHIAVDGKTV